VYKVGLRKAISDDWSDEKSKCCLRFCSKFSLLSKTYFLWFCLCEALRLLQADMAFGRLMSSFAV